MKTNKQTDTDYYVTDAQRGERLDVFLAGRDEQAHTRSFCAKLIKQGDVRVNGTAQKASYAVQSGDCVCVCLPAPQPTQVQAQDIALDIVYQDGDIVIVNKPQGMVVHPAAGNPDGTLVNALLFAIDDLAGIGGQQRPGIVHRIDKDTSGLLAVAKNDKAHQALSAQLQDKTMGRVYWAIVSGVVKADEGVIDRPIARSPKDRKKMAIVQGGRAAVTLYTVLERFATAGYTLVECRLKTGRTHQIRVHMASIGHPVAGDPVYGQKDKLKLGAQALHAYELHLIHPSTGKPMHFIAPLPPPFEQTLAKLRNLQ